jgi:ABC-type nitrate/sulfonate/bicarbonate transport system substrate-binding protein
VTTLKTAIGSYGHTKALKSGDVTPANTTLEFEEVSPIIGAFRRMCRGQEFDVSEMAITTYLCAKANNLPFTALPVFLVRAFHNGAVQVNSKQVSEPKDLEGKKVGVRAWTVTTGVWAKDILQNEFGVDLDKVNWVVADEEHVLEYKTPDNVTFQRGANLGEMLAAGELAAGIGIPKVDSPDVQPLAGNASEWYKKTGVYPINHTLVVKDDLLAANPSLAKDLYDAFKAARDAYVSGLASSTDDADAAMKRTADMVGGDPLPYGIEANRKAMEAIIAAATSQHILTKPTKVEDVFVSGAAAW